MVTAAMKLKDACSLEEKITNLDSVLKSRDITLLIKVHIVKAMFFFSSMAFQQEENGETNDGMVG